MTRTSGSSASRSEPSGPAGGWTGWKAGAGEGRGGPGRGLPDARRLSRRELLPVRGRGGPRHREPGQHPAAVPGRERGPRSAGGTVGETGHPIHAAAARDRGGAGPADAPDRRVPRLRPAGVRAPQLRGDHQPEGKAVNAMIEPLINRQTAPYPHVLAELVRQVSTPGRNWQFRLADEIRDPAGYGRGEASGLTLDILVTAPDTYSPDKLTRTRFLFPVPPATYDARS